jgi:hypothetical protein
MNQYRITLRASVNVRMADVAASTPQEAIAAAEKKADMHALFKLDRPMPGVAFTAYGEETAEALVDPAGDVEHKRSRWFGWYKGQWRPVPVTLRDELRRLDEKARSIRKTLGYSQSGEVIWQAAIDLDKLLVVVANGRGGASLLHVRGNYPVDYLLLEQLNFASEKAACEAAAKRLGG